MHAAGASQLTHAYPETAQLSRDDLHDLAAEAADPRAREEQDAYFAAFADSLEAVRALYDENVELARTCEDRTGVFAVRRVR